jgi:hypothetical protein
VTFNDVIKFVHERELYDERRKEKRRRGEEEKRRGGEKERRREGEKPS